MKKIRIGIAVFTAAIALVAVVGDTSFAKSRPSSCAWYVLNRTPTTPNPDKTIAANYTKYTGSGIKLSCPQQDVLCAVCLPDNGVTPNQTNLTAAQTAIQQAEDHDQETTDFIELRSPL